MVPALAMLLIVIWALALIKGQTAGGLVHVLLVAGVAILVVRFFRKRKADKAEAALRLKKRREILRNAGHW